MDWTPAPHISRRAWLHRLLAASASASLACPAFASSASLRFGLTPVMLDDRVGFLNAWAAWLGERLGQPVVFVQRSRYREILDLLLRGQLDLAWICGYPYVQHQADLALIAVPAYQGQPLYRSYVIVAADSPCDSLAALEGRLFAWADPNSNSGYLYPRAWLAERGHHPDRFFRRTFFTWGHPRSVIAVAEGLADGAAVDGYVWDTLARRDPTLTARTRVVLRSPLFGFPPIVARANQSAAARARWRALLLGQAEEASGRALLAELNLSGFVAAESELYAEIGAMARAFGANRPP